MPTPRSQPQRDTTLDALLDALDPIVGVDDPDAVDDVRSDAQGRLAAIADLHTERSRPIADVPADHVYCAECGQTWPCATRRVLDGPAWQHGRTYDRPDDQGETR